MEKHFSKISDIDKVIYLSKVIIALKVLRLHIIAELKLISRAKVKLIMCSHISSQLEEIDSILPKIQESIKNLLQSKFRGKEFGYNQQESWGLTGKDLQKGYLVLNETDNNGNYLGTDQDIEYRYILFLNDYTDKRFKIKQGDLLPFNEITSILGNQSNLFIGEIDANEYIKTIFTMTNKRTNLKNKYDS